MEEIPEDDRGYGTQRRAGDKYSASTRSRLETSFSLTPRRALQQRLHCGTGPALKRRGQPFVPSSQPVFGCRLWGLVVRGRTYSPKEVLGAAVSHSAVKPTATGQWADSLPKGVWAGYHPHHRALP